MNRNRFTKLDTILEEATKAVAPAIVCRVQISNELVYESAYGHLDPTVPTSSIDTNTIFDYASLTKLFTTTACLRMIDQGIVSVDTPVVEIVPSFSGRRPVGPTEDPITKLPAPTLPAWADSSYFVNADTITLWHLLTHTSGLPAWRNLFHPCGDIPEPGYSLSGAHIAERQHYGLEAICRSNFAYPTGQSFLYSDLGYILLGNTVARASGCADVAEAITELVSDPLQLTVRYNPTADMRHNIAPTEYCPWRGRRLHGEVHDENAAGLGGIAGHAGLFGTAEDLCKLGRAYLSASSGFLSTDTIATSIKCHVAADEPGEPLPYQDRPCDLSNAEIRRGLGWLLNCKRAPCGIEWSGSSFGHTGFTGTSLWCEPESRLIVALLTNRVYNGRDPDLIHNLRINVHTEIKRSLQ